MGPVSTSPFVKSQQQLGFRPIQNIDARNCQRIAKEFKQGMDSKTLKIETLNLLDAERCIQEVTENTRIEAALEKDLSACRRLYLQKEPSAASILTAAFLEAEYQSTEMNENGRLNTLKQQKQAQESSNILHKARSYARARDFNADHQIPDNLLSEQGDRYERLRQLKVMTKMTLPIHLTHRLQQNPHLHLLRCATSTIRMTREKLYRNLPNLF